MRRRPRRWAKALGAIVVVVALIVAGWVWHRARDSSPGGVRRAERARTPRASIPVEAAGGRLPWAIEPGIESRRIAGVVVADGKPVAGAAVELRLIRLPDQPPEAGPIETDADGRFDFGERPPAMYEVVASHAGFAPGFARVGTANPLWEPPADQTVVELETCAPITGRVRDTTGRYLAGAEVRQAPVFGSSKALVDTTDPDGRFRACGGWTLIEVRAEGYGVAIVQARNLIGLEPEIVLMPEGAIEGIVVDVSGRPVASALVSVEPRFSMGMEATAISDEAGRFRVGGLGPGRFEIRAEHPSHGRSGGTIVMVGAQQTTPEVTVELTTRCRQVSGRVERRGQPVAGVGIFDGVSQLDGSFVARCAPVGEEEVMTWGWIIASPRTLPPGDQPIDDLLVEVSPGAVVKGRVLIDGKPVKAAMVRDSSTFSFTMTESRGDGSYELRGLAAGTYQLYAFDRATGRKAPAVAVEVTAESETVLDFALDEAGSVSGVVLGADGQPAQGLDVYALEPGTSPERRGLARGPPRGRTGVDGAFVIRGLAAGTYQLKAGRSSTDLAEADTWPTITLRDGEARSGVAIQLETPGRGVLAGRVETTAGAPVGSARVVAGDIQTSTDPDGRFLVTGLAPGRVLVRVASLEGGTVDLYDVQVGREDVVVILDPPAGLDAVIDASAEDWEVELRRSDKDRSAPFMADVRGRRFSVRGMQPGEYVVKVRGPGGVGSAAVTLRSGEVAAVTIPIGATARVHGVARQYPGGEPAPGVRCRHALGGSGPGAKTDSSGEFVLDGVPSGDSKIVCGLNPMDMFSPQGKKQMGVAGVHVEPAGTAEVEVWLVDVDLEEVASGAGGDLGLKLRDRGSGATAELVVEEVAADGPASAAGVKVGDLLVQVDGVPAGGWRAPATILFLQSRPPGARVGLTLRRGDTEQSVVVTAAPGQP